MLKQYLLDIRSKHNRMGFMPFWMAGYPSTEESINRMRVLLKYADVMEVGIPFSDSPADGPIIQKASEHCIASGFKNEQVFDIIRQANADHNKPIVILCYLNTVLQHGVERFMKSARSSGVLAVLIPDMPPEESEIVAKQAEMCGIKLVYVVSTNTPIARIRLIDSMLDSFMYFVSRPSVTGTSDTEIARETIDIIDAVKNITTNPLYVGFGISNTKQVVQYRDTRCDGFIIGSKLFTLGDDEFEPFLQDVVSCLV